MSLLNSASLCVTPNAYKEGTLYSVIPNSTLGDMTVVRATTATRVNSAGLIELVPYNLFTYSEQFDNVDWQKISVTVTPNTTIAPNGTLTADTLVVSSSGYLYRQINYSASLGNSITMSIYTKNSDANFLIFAAATIAGTDVSTIVNVGNGWYRHIVTRTFTTSATGLIQFLLGYTFTGTYYIWGAQLVEGTLPKDYLRTETRLNIPRLDYSNGSCPSLLVEPQSTNLALYSEQFDNTAYWSPYNATLTGNTMVAPDGTTTADTIISNASTGGDVYRLITLNGTYTLSAYFKSGTTANAGIGYSNGVLATYNLTNQTFVVTGSGTAKIENANNGWYRCSLTTTITAGTLIAYSASGTTGQTINIWGAQLEAGSYPTSYIPTTSAAVTRNADVISKTGISSLIGQTEGTVFVEVDISNTGITRIPIVISSANPSTSTSEAYFYINGAGNLVFEFYTAGIAQCSISAGAIQVGVQKLAFVYKNNDFAFYRNGTQVGVDTSGTVASGLDRLYLGCFTNNGLQLNDRINSAVIFPTRLTNAELASLTT
jgi:hypothetical protein